MKITKSWECRKSLLIALIVVTFGTGGFVSYSKGNQQAIADVVTFCDTEGAFAINNKVYICEPIKVKGIQS